MGREFDRWLEQPVRIDGEPWFDELKRVTGNFAFGLQRINDTRVSQGLRDASLIATENVPETDLRKAERLRFGTPEGNKAVELAAVTAVCQEYEAKGWRVVSHEERRCGYDLYCTNGREVHGVVPKIETRLNSKNSDRRI